MKTSEIFKVSYGVTLGFLCAKFTFKVGCKIIEKICDVGIDKVERNRKVKYNPYYTKEESDTDEHIEKEEDKDDEVEASE